MRIDARIDRALKDHGDKHGLIEFSRLATLVFPKDQYPRAGGKPTRGGPPGCFMALSSAIRRYGFYDHMAGVGHRYIGPRPSASENKP